MTFPSAIGSILNKTFPGQVDEQKSGVYAISLATDRSVAKLVRRVLNPIPTGMVVVIKVTRTQLIVREGDSSLLRGGKKVSLDDIAMGAAAYRQELEDLGNIIKQYRARHGSQELT